VKSILFEYPGDFPATIPAPGKLKKLDMKNFLKQHLQEGKEIIFDNEKTFTDDFKSMECTFRNEAKNTWANGFKIEFNGALFSFKTFDAFFKKFTQLKTGWNLELKSW